MYRPYNANKISGVLVVEKSLSLGKNLSPVITFSFVFSVLKISFGLTIFLERSVQKCVHDIWKCREVLKGKGILMCQPCCNISPSCSLEKNLFGKFFVHICGRMQQSQLGHVLQTGYKTVLYVRLAYPDASNASISWHLSNSHWR